jgi:hypothetical protein
VVGEKPETVVVVVVEGTDAVVEGPPDALVVVVVTGGATGAMTAKCVPVITVIGAVSLGS